MRIPKTGIILTLLAFLAACSPNNVTIKDNLKHFFDEKGVIGSFALYDNGTGQFSIYNLARYRDTAFSPASTFKIVNSLIGLETGKIFNEKMVIKWDGIKRPLPYNDTAYSWNEDLTMEQAFKRSALPYYQEVARRIGKDTMQFWLDSLKYGNRLMGKTVDQFWIDNTLKITADEQMGLVKKLFFNQLPFQKRTQEIVRKLMLQEENANYKLAYKTGMTYRENGQKIGWIVGWIEENKHPYFFVLHVEGNQDSAIATIRKEILVAILKDLGFLEGKR